MKYLPKVLFFLLACSFLAACNSSDDEEDDDRTYIRMFNGVPNVPAVDLLVDSDTYFSNVGYLEETGYFKVDTGAQRLTVVISNTFTSLFDQIVGLDDQSDQSLIIYGLGSNSRSLLLRDDNEKPGGGLAKIRIINISLSSRSTDVYVVEKRVDLLEAAPTADNLGVGGVSNYFISDSGDYNITVTSASTGELLTRTIPVTFESDKIYTIIIADTAPGELPAKIVVLQDN